MTTVDDDTDLFTDAFTGFGSDDATRHRSRSLAAIALVGAAVLVAGATLWVRMGPEPAAASPVDPVGALAVLAQPQRSTDVVPDDDLAGSLIDPASTRLVAQTSDARYYAGVSRTHQLCVLSLRAGDLPATTCTSTTGGTVHLVVEDELMLVSAGEPAPAGWHEAGPAVLVKD